MQQTGLDFAPGTTDECKKLVAGLFTPSELVSAYRAARNQVSTGDLVMVTSEQDPSRFEAWERGAYVKHVKQRMGKLPLLFAGIISKSAHSVVQLPIDSEAMWLIVARERGEMPIMCVVFTTSFKMAASGN